MASGGALAGPEEAGDAPNGDAAVATAALQVEHKGRALTPPAEVVASRRSSVSAGTHASHDDSPVRVREIAAEAAKAVTQTLQDAVAAALQRVAVDVAGEVQRQVAKAAAEAGALESARARAALAARDAEVEMLRRRVAQLERRVAAVQGTDAPPCVGGDDGVDGEADSAGGKGGGADTEVGVEDRKSGKEAEAAEEGEGGDSAAAGDAVSETKGVPEARRVAELEGVLLESAAMREAERQEASAREEALRTELAGAKAETEGSREALAYAAVELAKALGGVKPASDGGGDAGETASAASGSAAVRAAAAAASQRRQGGAPHVPPRHVLESVAAMHPAIARALEAALAKPGVAGRAAAPDAASGGAAPAAGMGMPVARAVAAATQPGDTVELVVPAELLHVLPPLPTAEGRDDPATAEAFVARVLGRTTPADDAADAASPADASTQRAQAEARAEARAADEATATGGGGAGVGIFLRGLDGESVSPAAPVAVPENASQHRGDSVPLDVPRAEEQQKGEVEVEVEMEGAVQAGEAKTEEVGGVEAEAEADAGGDLVVGGGEASPAPSPAGSVDVAADGWVDAPVAPLDVATEALAPVDGVVSAEDEVFTPPRVSRSGGASAASSPPQVGAEYSMWSSGGLSVQAPRAASASVVASVATSPSGQRSAVAPIAAVSAPALPLPPALPPGLPPAHALGSDPVARDAPAGAVSGAVAPGWMTGPYARPSAPVSGAEAAGAVGGGVGGAVAPNAAAELHRSASPNILGILLGGTVAVGPDVPQHAGVVTPGEARHGGAEVDGAIDQAGLLGSLLDMDDDVGAHPSSRVASVGVSAAAAPTYHAVGHAPPASMAMMGSTAVAVDDEVDADVDAMFDERHGVQHHMPRGRERRGNEARLGHRHFPHGFDLLQPTAPAGASTTAGTATHQRPSPGARGTGGPHRRPGSGPPAGGRYPRGAGPVYGRGGGFTSGRGRGRGRGGGVGDGGGGARGGREPRGAGRRGEGTFFKAGRHGRGGGGGGGGEWQSSRGRRRQAARR